MVLRVQFVTYFSSHIKPKMVHVTHVAGVHLFSLLHAIPLYKYILIHFPGLLITDIEVVLYFFELESCYIAQTGLEFSMWPRLTSNL
jgi:hypothetical protein